MSVSPINRKIEEYKAAFMAWHTLLQDCWAMIDGLKLYLQQAGNMVIQERYYNGWTNDHYETSVICFCPNNGREMLHIGIWGS